MRIAVVGLRGMYDAIGGIETHCRELYPAMAKRHSDWSITVFERSRYRSRPRPHPDNLTLRSLYAPNSSGFEALLHTLLAMFVAAIRVRPNILHIHSVGPAIWTPLARLLGMQVIVTMHARDYERPKWGPLANRLLRFGEYLACRFADAVICVSSATLSELSDSHPRSSHKFFAIPHGIEPFSHDAEEGGLAVLDELGVKPGGYILAVGRLERTKRFQDLLEAKRRSSRATLPLILVGSTIGMSAEEDFKSWEKQNGVILAGTRMGSELAQLYRHASLFIHPSQMEGFGLVVLEALNAGVPIAVSNLPAHREFNLPDHCYFEVGDVDAIARIMAADDHRVYTPQEGTEILSRYSVKRMIEGHEHVLHTVAKSVTRS